MRTCRSDECACLQVLGVLTFVTSVTIALVVFPARDSSEHQAHYVIGLVLIGMLGTQASAARYGSTVPLQNM